jgi:L-ascorbate metabolism protein UlaG (beta-lactamase superfamily)
MEFKDIIWLGHASFAIRAGKKLLYVDPFRIGGFSEHADTVLVTHPHFDHFSVDEIKNVSGQETEVFVPKDSVDKVKHVKAIEVEPFKSYSSNGINFRTIPAYNVEKERLQFHPRANGWVSYIIEANGLKIFHPGDTDNVDEMEGLDVDIALLPIGGTYTMDVDQAIAASKRINAKAFVPMHYKAVLGRERADEAEQKFLRNVRNSHLLKEFGEPYYSFE